MNSVRILADSAVEDLRTLISRAHTEIVDGIDVDPGSGLSIDLIAEDRLGDVLSERIAAYLMDFNTTTDRCDALLLNISVDCMPILASVPGPVPDPADPDINGTGCTNYTGACEMLGVGSEVTATVRFEGEGIVLDRDVVVHAQRRSLAQLSASRVERASAEIESGELHRLAGYLISSYAQQKAFMGYGKGRNGSYEGPLITPDEVSSIIDLAVEMTTGSHLLSSDASFIDNVSEDLRSLPISGGAPLDLKDVLRGSEDPLDAVTALVLSTGIMSEGNEPSLSEIVDPIFDYLIDILVERFVSYTGIDDREIQDVLLSFENAKRVISEGVVTELGLEVKDEGTKNAYDVLLSLLSEYGINISGGFSLMRRDYPVLLHQGQSIVSYPNIAPGPVRSEFVILASDYDPSHVFYRDENGSYHSGAEGERPGDVYAYHLCNRYELSVNFSVDPFECMLEEVALDGSEFKAALVGIMGGLETEVRSVLDKAEMTLRNSLETIIEKMRIEDLVLFNGWNRTSRPSVTGDVPVTLDLLDRDKDALGAFLEYLSGDLTMSLDLSGFGETLRGYERSLGDSIARWLNDTYKQLVGAQELADTALDRSIEHFLDSCAANVVSIRLNGTAQADQKDVVFPPNGIDDTGYLIGDRDLLVRIGLEVGGAGDAMEELERHLQDLIWDAISEVMLREVGPGGIITEALTGSSTRGGGIFQSISDLGQDRVLSLLQEMVLPVLDSIGAGIIRGYDIAGARALVPPTEYRDGIIEPKAWGSDNASFGSIRAVMHLEPMSDPRTMVSIEEGVHEAEPDPEKVPYKTYISVNYSRTFRLEYALNGEAYPAGSSASKELTVDLDLLVPIEGTYALDGCEYDETATFWDDVISGAGSAARQAIEVLSSGSSGMLGGSLSSLSELPPLISDVIGGKDLDLAEIARVLTNITMDLSSTLREAVKELILSLAEGAISAGLEMLMDLLDIEVLHAAFNIGGLKMDLTSDTDALDGGDGRLLLLKASIPTLGMNGYFGLIRNDSKVSFNGTVEVEKGPLYLRLELDPLLEVRGSIVSVQGIYHGEGEDIRISIKAPELVEYRSSEITLESLLGMEPNVFIAPIGTSVFFNGGFRITYRTPEELDPLINELRFSGSNLTSLEIFNPGSDQLAGYTVEMAPPNAAPYGTHSLNIVMKQRFAVFSLGNETLKRWSRDIVPGKPMSVILRDPSGEVKDRILVRGMDEGWYSRDADGYGVFRWGNGTPGETNGGLASFSFTGLLFSLVSTSLEEAWAEATELYGMSFETVVYFIQRSMDLFVERVCSTIAELIVDVRIFVSMKVALGTGASAGVGVELSFLAEGEAIAEFIEWLYENIKVLIAKIFDPQGAGDFRAFPMTILEKCHIEVQIYSEVDTPPALSKMAPKGSEIPSSLTLAIAGRFNIALPFRLLGKDMGDWKVSAGIYVKDAPSVIVSIFYDVNSLDSTKELWLLRVTVWSEGVSG